MNRERRKNGIPRDHPSGTVIDKQRNGACLIVGASDLRGSGARPLSFNPLLLG
jgi:hypothetical protein